MKPVLRLAPVLIGVAVALSCEVQQTTSPRPALSLSKEAKDAAGSRNACVGDKDKDKKRAPMAVLCAITVPGNPLVSVAKGWTDHELKAYYVDDQSNKAVDIIDARSYTFAGRVGGFVGAATGGSGGTITYGGGTATTNGQGPNSMAPVGDHTLWVSDGNSTVHVLRIDEHSAGMIASISTAMPACDGGTPTTHYCGRINEMTYDPEDHIILVENPNPLDLTYCTTAGNNCNTTAAVSYPTLTPKTLAPYATFISAKPPYQILGRISFPLTKGTTEAPVWNGKTHRFLLPVPTCSAASGVLACGPGGATQYIAVIDPKTLTVEKTFMLPDCQHLMPGVPIPGTGMLNDLSIDEKDQRVLMPVCGKGEVIFDAGTGDVVNVVTEIGSSDETWFNPGDGRFYVVSGTPGGITVGNANTTSLGVVDGESGLWLQNVLNVGGKIPAALGDGINRTFTTVTVPVGVNPARDSTACAAFGFTGTGCITVFEHEDGKTKHESDFGHEDGESEHESD